MMTLITAAKETKMVRAPDKFEMWCGLGFKLRSDHSAGVVSW